MDIATCVRARATPPQTQLSAAQRRHNLHDAFRLARPLADRHIAVLDDVMTTGSTLEHTRRTVAPRWRGAHRRLGVRAYHAR
jgi:predicted amidophosphoribosyltransferase